MMIVKKIFLFLFVVYVIQGLFFSSVFAEVLQDDQSDFVLPQYSHSVSLDFKNADLRDVLKAFSRQIGVNFIISEDVKAGPITVFLESVPVEDALKKILTANGLFGKYDAADNILVVGSMATKKKFITRVYALKYATVSTSKLLSTFALGGGSAAGGTLVDSLKAVVSSAAKIAEDPRTNSLIITDEEDRFPIIEQTLARLDIPIAQILIEVQMIDTSKEALDEVGVKFGNTFFELAGLGGKNYYYPLDQAKILNNGGSLTYTSGTLNGGAFSAVLQFLSSRTDTKSLAHPKIMTMNNEMAQIKVTASEVVGVTTTAATSTSPMTQSAERTETGITLTVTPQVNLITGDILLAIEPLVAASRTGATFNSQTYKDPETRSAKVKMKIHSGDTVVLGGLLRSEEEKIVIKLPFLGDIPLLGRLFRHDRVSIKNKELLIFITPRVIDLFDGAPRVGSVNNLGARESRVTVRQAMVSAALDSVGR
ncbi:MAG: secretin N-terminal domain-containing protein [Candidatus Omnitrophota bacterium]